MMSMNKIDNSEQNSQKISDQLQQVILNSIRNADLIPNSAFLAKKSLFYRRNRHLGPLG